MGILNVTPDSFSDGGTYFDVQNAVARGVQMEEEGADFIDIGGESSRPGSDPVSEEEELRRILPVTESLAERVSIPLSIDTYKSNVADCALKAGAQIVNDISGLMFDARMIDIVARHGACVVLMHMKGTPKSMQANPTYDDVVEEVADFLLQRATVASSQGVERIIVDPGLGFGKTFEHNLELIRKFQRIVQVGFPVLVGPSRKSFIGKLLDAPIEERLEGTAAAVTTLILRGANIVRVHDVKQMKRVAVVADALKNSTTDV